MNAIGTAAACSQPNRSGMSVASADSTRTYSEKLPLARAMTRSPTANAVTPMPTAQTSPAASTPPGRATSALCRAIVARMSPRFNEVARTFSKSCPGPGTGTGMSRSSNVVVPFATPLIQYDFNDASGFFKWISLSEFRAWHEPHLWLPLHVPPNGRIQQNGRRVRRSWDTRVQDKDSPPVLAQDVHPAPVPISKH